VRLMHDSLSLTTKSCCLPGVCTSLWSLLCPDGGCWWSGEELAARRSGGPPCV